MKKLHKLFIIIGVVLVVIVLGYQLIVARVSTEMFDAMKYNTFQLGMSSTRAKSLFSAYGELTQITESESSYGKTTMLTFSKGTFKETLVLNFTNDKLSGFSYTNWQVK